MYSIDIIKLSCMTPGWGGRLKAARLAEGFTQTEIAKACGVSKEAVSQWEAEKIRRMTIVHLLRAARKLRRTPGWIALGARPEYAAVADEDRARWNAMYRQMTLTQRRAALRLLEEAFIHTG